MSSRRVRIKQADQLIFIYLYRFQGIPVYVGQTVNVVKRHRVHLKGKLFFDKALRINKEIATIEVVATVRDVPGGKKSRKLEAQIVVKYRTFTPAIYFWESPQFHGLGFNVIPPKRWKKIVTITDKRGYVISCRDRCQIDKQLKAHYYVLRNALLMARVSFDWDPAMLRYRLGAAA